MGLSVLETYPSVLGTALWRGYLDALENGVRYEGEPFAYEEVLAGIPTSPASPSARRPARAD